MRLSLAIALFLAAPLGADVVPQAKSNGNDEPNKIVQMVTVSGECSKLVHAGLRWMAASPSW